MAKLLRMAEGSPFFKTIAGLRKPGGFPRSALALIVEKCEDYRNPYRKTHSTLIDIARMARAKPGSVYVLFEAQGVVEDVKNGRSKLFDNKRLPALLDLIDQRRFSHPDYATVHELAKRFGVDWGQVKRQIDDEKLVPDRVNALGAYQFRRERLPELDLKWEKRLESYPAWAPVRVVITPYGMMRPRVVPRGEVFALGILSLPEKPMHDSFRPKPTFYNLSDLSGSPSDAPSKTIFASTSLKNVRTRVGSKSRRRTS